MLHKIAAMWCKSGTPKVTKLCWCIIAFYSECEINDIVTGNSDNLAFPSSLVFAKSCHPLHNHRIIETSALSFPNSCFIESLSSLWREGRRRDNRGCGISQNSQHWFIAIHLEMPVFLIRNTCLAKWQIRNVWNCVNKIRLVKTWLY